MSGIKFSVGIFGRSCNVGFVAFVGGGMEWCQMYLVMKEVKKL